MGAGQVEACQTDVGGHGYFFFLVGAGLTVFRVSGPILVVSRWPSDEQPQLCRGRAGFKRKRGVLEPAQSDVSSLFIGKEVSASQFLMRDGMRRNVSSE